MANTWNLCDPERNPAFVVLRLHPQPESAVGEVLARIQVAGLPDLPGSREYLASGTFFASEVYRSASFPRMNRKALTLRIPAKPITIPS